MFPKQRGHDLCSGRPMQNFRGNQREHGSLKWGSCGVSIFFDAHSIWFYGSSTNGARTWMSKSARNPWLLPSRPVRLPSLKYATSIAANIPDLNANRGAPSSDRPRVFALPPPPRQGSIISAPRPSSGATNEGLACPLNNV